MVEDVRSKAITVSALLGSHGYPGGRRLILARLRSTDAIVESRETKERDSDAELVSGAKFWHNTLFDALSWEQRVSHPFAEMLAALESFDDALGRLNGHPRLRQALAGEIDGIRGAIALGKVTVPDDIQQWGELSAQLHRAIIGFEAGDGLASAITAFLAATEPRVESRVPTVVVMTSGAEAADSDENHRGGVLSLPVLQTA